MPRRFCFFLNIVDLIFFLFELTAGFSVLLCVEGPALAVDFVSRGDGYERISVNCVDDIEHLVVFTDGKCEQYHLFLFA